MKCNRGLDSSVKPMGVILDIVAYIFVLSFLVIASINAKEDEVK